MTPEQTDATETQEADPDAEAAVGVEEPAPDPVRLARHPHVVALTRQVQGLLADQHRVLVGLAGLPGAGKSEVADVLVSRLRVLGVPAASVPMSGFRLDQREVLRLGRASRYGAPDTFDVGGYVALLRRLRAGDESVVLAPRYDHDLQQPVGSALPVVPAVRVVVTVGSYLLLRHDDLGRPAVDDMTMPGWNRVRDQLDTCWYVETDPSLRAERLAARRAARGRPEATTGWVMGDDDVDARLVEGTRSRADGVVDWG